MTRTFITTQTIEIEIDITVEYTYDYDDDGCGSPEQSGSSMTGRRGPKHIEVQGHNFDETIALALVHAAVNKLDLDEITKEETQDD